MNNYQAPTRFVGKKTKYIESCESTNELGFQEALKEEIPEGFAWIAGHQTAGKGQRGNQWFAQANQNLLVSYLLKPRQDLLPTQFYLSKAIANGIIEGLQLWAKSTYGDPLPLKIKWPNDIYLDEKKLGGILIESNFQAGKWAFSIIGIGLNINQWEFDGLRATSLRKWTQNPLPIDISEVFNYLSIGVENGYQAFQNQTLELIDASYHQDLFRKDSWHYFEDKNGQFEGKIERVNEQGLLIIDKIPKTEHYEIKELSFIFKDKP